MPDLASQTADALKRAVDKHQKGDVKAAAKLYKQVLKNHSGNFLANNYYGLILMREGKLKQALRHFKSALDGKPGWEEAHANIAQASLKLGDMQQAIDHAGKAPGHYGALMCLGAAQHALGEPKKALKSFEKAAKIQPDNPGVYNSIGGIYAEAEKYAEATKWFEKAIKLKPDFALAWNNYAVALRYCERFKDSLKAYDMAIQINPDYTSAISNRSDLKTFLGQSEGALADYESIYNKTDLTESMHSNYLMALHYAPDVEMETIFEKQKDWGRRFSDPKKPKKHERGAGIKNAGSPLRIGFVSGNFNRHPVGFMILAAVENLNKERFSLHYLSDTNIDKHDEITLRIKATAKTWHDTRYISEGQFLELLEKEKIDVLFDLSGYSEGSRMSLFGYRPAPVQVKWVGGLFGTTGMRDMDWIIGDPVEIPDGDERWYTEKIYRMPDDYICYTPPSYLPDASPPPAVENGFVTFGNFNNGPKTNSVGIKLWSDVLKALPGSKLMLKNKIYNHNIVTRDLLNKMADHGVGEDRIIFRGGTSHKDHLSALNDVDIALDPYPYTGGLTTCESLMMGVPTITWPGPHFAGKHSATHLTAAGYTEFIAGSAEDYVALAQKWAEDIDALADLRAGMREKVLASPLCDAERFAKNFEAFLREIMS